MSDPTQVVVTDARLPADTMILEGIDVSREPIFTVSEVGKFFFARSPHWVRWAERNGRFILDGKDDCTHVITERVEKNGKASEKVVGPDVEDGECRRCGGRDVGGIRSDEGARRYTLMHVEQMAHALAQNDAINGAQLTNALFLVQTEARLWGYL